MKVATILTLAGPVFLNTAQGSTPISEPTAEHEFAQLLEKSTCHDQLTEVLSKWNSANQWIRRVPGDNGEAVFETPTQRIGYWIQVIFPKARHAPRATQRSNGGDIAVSWNETDCSPLMGVKLNDAPAPAIGADFFTDTMLESELKKNKAGIIYGWSPMMPLSIIGYNEAKAVAKKLNLAFIPLLDPMVDLEIAKTASTDYKLKEGIRKVGSVELLERGMNLHYPSILFFSKGKMVGSLLPGLWDSPQALEAVIKGAIQ